jgi:hypothetical protein
MEQISNSTDLLRASIFEIKSEGETDANRYAVNYVRLALGVLEFEAARKAGKVLDLTEDQWKSIETLPTGKNGYLLVGAGE